MALSEWLRRSGRRSAKEGIGYLLNKDLLREALEKERKDLRVQNRKSDPIGTIAKKRKRLIPVLCGVNAAAKAFKVEVQDVAGDRLVIRDLWPENMRLSEDNAVPE